MLLKHLLLAADNYSIVGYRDCRICNVIFLEKTEKTARKTEIQFLVISMTNVMTSQYYSMIRSMKRKNPYVWMTHTIFACLVESIKRQSIKKIPVFSTSFHIEDLPNVSFGVSSHFELDFYRKTNMINVPDEEFFGYFHHQRHYHFETKRFP